MVSLYANNNNNNNNNNNKMVTIVIINDIDLFCDYSVLVTMHVVWFEGCAGAVHPS